MVSCSPTLATCTSMESSIKDSDKGPVIHFCIKLELPISELLQAIEQFREQMIISDKAGLHEEILAKAVLMDEVKMKEARLAAEEFEALVQQTGADWPWGQHWYDEELVELPIGGNNHRMNGFANWSHMPGSGFCLEPVQEDAFKKLHFSTSVSEYMINKRKHGTSSDESWNPWAINEFNPDGKKVFAAYHRRNNNAKLGKCEKWKVHDHVLACSRADEPSSLGPSSRSLRGGPSRRSIISSTIRTLTSSDRVDQGASPVDSSEVLTAALAKELADDDDENKHNGEECKQA